MDPGETVETIHKILTVIVILCLVLTTAPMTSCSIASTDTPTVELTVSLSGMNHNPRTITITQNQNDQLQRILESTRNKMKTISSKEEALSLYHDALQQCVSLGILDETTANAAMHVAAAKPIQINTHQNNAQSNEVFTNSDCFLEGYTAQDQNYLTFFTQKFPIQLAYTLTFWPAVFAAHYNLKNMEDALIYVLAGYMVLEFLRMYRDDFSYPPLPDLPELFIQRPLILNGCFYFGYAFYLTDYAPATGWIQTSGSQGNLDWNGSWYGDITRPRYPPFLEFTVEFFPGVTGFTGILFHYRNYYASPTNYLGFARNIKLSRTPPSLNK